VNASELSQKPGAKTVAVVSPLQLFVDPHRRDFLWRVYS
jgi:hypothetical protein